MSKRDNIINAGAALAVALGGPTVAAFFPLAELLKREGVDVEDQDFQEAMATQTEKLRGKEAKDGLEIEEIYTGLD